MTLSNKQKFVWIPIIWMVLGIVYAFQIYFYNINLGSDCEPFSFMAYYIPEYLLWAIYTPFIFKLNNRFPITEDKKWSIVLKVLPFALMLAFIHLLLIAALRWFFYQWYDYSTISDSLGSYIIAETSTQFFIPILFFSCTLAVGYLLQYYNKNQELQMESLNLDKKLTQAQLKNLKSQLQPHFLFNALNTISMLVRQNENKNAVKMISGLGGLLRYALDNKESQWSTIGIELEVIEKYLLIESIRFENKLKYTINIEDKLKDTPIPDLLLQPIVENSLKHGFDNFKINGRIEIDVFKDEQFYNIKVNDNGKGFNTKESPFGFGLNSTLERLEKLYKGKAQFLIEGVPDKGTKITIKIPIEY
jgi:sensor histidine kinase YesM